MLHSHRSPHLCSPAFLGLRALRLEYVVDGELMETQNSVRLLETSRLSPFLHGFPNEAYFGRSDRKRAARSALTNVVNNEPSQCLDGGLTFS